MRYFEEYCEVHLEPTLAPHRWVFRRDEPIRIRFGVALHKAPLQGEIWYRVSDGERVDEEERLVAQAEAVRQNGYQFFGATLPTVANGCYRYRFGYRAADGREHTSQESRCLFVNDDAPRTMAEIGSTFLDVVDGHALYGPLPQVPITAGPQRWDNRLIYSLLTDRFARSTAQDRAGLGVVTYDPTSVYRSHGGTLQGVIEKLPYLKALGVGAILLSPIYVNNSAGYHGYYLTHLLMVDPGQGTLADLRALVAEAHRLDLAVLLDVVCNHIGDSISWQPDAEGTVGEFQYVNNQHAYHSKRGLLTTFSYVGSQETPVLPYPEEARNPALFHGTEYTDMVRQRLFGVMEDWRTEIPYVRNLLIDHLKYWIAVTNIDGFRHDAARHIEPEFWQHCIAEINRYTKYLGKTNFLHIAEHAGVTAAELAAYNRARFPSMLDFPTFYTLIRSLEATNRLQGLADYFCGYLRQQEQYGVDGRANVMFLDGHDRTRIYHEFLRLLPNRGLAEICFHFALACLILGPQPPMLYYGTEQEFSGALAPITGKRRMNGWGMTAMSVKICSLILNALGNLGRSTMRVMHPIAPTTRPFN